MEIKEKIVENKIYIADDYTKFEKGEVHTYTLENEFLFYKTENCNNTVAVYDWWSGTYNYLQLGCEPVKDREVNITFGDLEYRLVYSISELPKLDTYLQLMYMWATTTPSEGEGDELVLHQKLTVGNTTFAWKLPEKGLQYFEMERGGFVAFEDLFLPCFTDHDIEISFYDVDDISAHDPSASHTVNCSNSSGIVAYDFHVDGRDENKGHYKVFGRMNQTGKLN